MLAASPIGAILPPSRSWFGARRPGANVCSRMTRCEQDAEDGFRATFLTLANKARTIGRMIPWRAGSTELPSGPHWSSSEIATLGKHLRGPPITAGKDPLDETITHEVNEILHREVVRFPEKYRVPILLSCFQGRSNQEIRTRADCGGDCANPIGPCPRKAPDEARPARRSRPRTLAGPWPERAADPVATHFLYRRVGLRFHCWRNWQHDRGVGCPPGAEGPVCSKARSLHGRDNPVAGFWRSGGTVAPHGSRRQNRAHTAPNEAREENNDAKNIIGTWERTQSPHTRSPNLVRLRIQKPF